MSEDKTWMHRAFPNLAPAEAEDCVHGLHERESLNLEGMVEVAEALDDLPYVTPPDHIDALSHEEIRRRFLSGDEPIPDLATAEYIRRKLQHQLSGWAKDFFQIQSAVVANILGRKSRRTDAHQKRCLLWHLSDGNITRVGVIKELARKLDREAALCKIYGFPVGIKAKKVRTSVVRELIKEMRTDVRAGRRPYVLTIEEEQYVTAWLDFDDLDAQDELDSKN
jgi:hypothetical protein